MKENKKIKKNKSDFHQIAKNKNGRSSYKEGKFRRAQSLLRFFDQNRFNEMTNVENIQHTKQQINIYNSIFASTGFNRNIDATFLMSHER